MKSALLAGLVVVLASCSGEAPVDSEVIIKKDSSTSQDDTGSSDEDTGTIDNDTGSAPDTVVADTGSAPIDTGESDTGAATDTSVADGTAETSADAALDVGTDASVHAIQYVWIIVMENRNWSSIKGSASAPYINKTLLPAYASAEQYYNPPKLHPSEPNYIWMEAGDNLGITDDADPAANHKSTTDHLVTKLQAAGVSWKSYQEDIDGAKCPLTSVKQYAPKHNPMIYFDDVTDGNSATSANCIAHVRPYPDLFTDAAAGKVPRYSFITPNLCNDMHGETFGTTCPVITDLIKRGDTWLSVEVPKIMALPEYKTGGAIFITWDEGEGLITKSDGPIGMIVVSPFAKKGYSNTIKYTHSSLLRTVQSIFDVTPFIRGAATATDLSDLFTATP
jgi:phosphatidylinositol-3-phosphatase